ncbi:hypothetical protein ACFE04_005083 [Oxalis oulophora]
MALSTGSTPYYIHGGFPTSQQQQQQQQPPATTLQQSPPGFRHYQTNPNHASSDPSFSHHHPTFPHATSNLGLLTEPVKKKRGRPRKYAPQGVDLGCSPLPVRPKASSESGSPSQKRTKGRPPGTGRKQQLAALGYAFAPHVICIERGEDIVEKLLTFSQQRPRALCIMSGTGTISSGTLRQPGTMTPTVSFEGNFDILCFSGSYLVAEEGSPHSRTGGISASLSTHDGHVIGGGVAKLIAAGPVQVVVCSFVHGTSKTKSRQVTSPTGDTDYSQQPNDRSTTPNATPTQNYSPSPSSVWPGSRQVDLRRPHTDFDLTHG